MKQSIGVSTLLLILLFVLPLLVITPVLHRQLAESEEPSEPLTIIPGDIDSAETVRVLDDGTVQEMTLANYLVGVVRAEMPASFEREALRAQAVAARTYTLYKIKNGGNHGDTADVCTDPKCCQAYISEEAARSNWGAKADDYEAKIEDAVYSTDGQAILYDGQPILAAFHSSSPGYTRSAGEVWLTDLPYLQSVSSPEKGDAIPNYYSRAEFTAEDFKKRVLAAYPEADLSGAMSCWLTGAVTDSSGSIETVKVGGVTVKGGSLRSALGLRSACYEWEVQSKKLVFFVTGFGHGVGMSQYGANQMAKDGSDYEDILTHYYTGVTVGTCTLPDRG